MKKSTKFIWIAVLALLGATALVQSSQTAEAAATSTRPPRGPVQFGG